MLASLLSHGMSPSTNRALAKISIMQIKKTISADVIADSVVKDEPRTDSIIEPFNVQPFRSYI